MPECIECGEQFDRAEDESQRELLERMLRHFETEHDYFA